MQEPDSMRQIGPADFRIVQAAEAPAEQARTDECSCGGAGFYKKAVPYSHPDFARLYPCPCRTPGTRAHTRARLLQRTGLAPLRDRTFATFNRRLPGVGAAYQRSQAYAAAWPHQQWMVYLGRTGSGKTHLSLAIANSVFDQSPDDRDTVYYAAVPDLLDHLRSCYNPGGPAPFHEEFERIKGIGLLVLDDVLTTERLTVWGYEKLYQIINHRNLHRLPTIVSTNLALDQLDERLVSRMLDADILPDGPIDMSAAADHRRRNLRGQRKEAV
ncbi:MAG TPA: ATP-binding protein [Roseiflexaceae bacterium]|nr:ATP-binding protein [Roseiflexaceae bacterium]